MIYSYGVTQRGYYHINNGTVCQDAHFIKKISDSLCIAAVADGLGSEDFSDIASKIAVETAVEFCAEKYVEHDNKDKILDLIKTAYKTALQAIIKKAEDDKQPIDQYDTTLSLVIFDKDKAYFGHSGDSGIVGLFKTGEFKAITAQQRDENGCVFPLCFEDKWEFGFVEDVASVLLATDGMLETLFPSLLYNEPIPIYVALANFFMDKEALGYNSLSEKEVQEKIDKFVSGIAEAQVNDDKTIVCILNSDIEVQKREDDYYKIPDWVALKKKKEEEFKRLAYPHLYKKDNENNEDSNSSTETVKTNKVVEEAENNDDIESKKETDK